MDTPVSTTETIGTSLTNQVTMYKAHLNPENGKLLGWYQDAFHGDKTPTENTVEVTEAVWQAALNINANCYENGEFIVKDFRTEEEVIADNLKAKIAEANNYLKETEWVESYKLRHDTGLELIPETSAKWPIITKREEYKAYLRTL